MRNLLKTTLLPHPLAAPFVLVGGLVGGTDGMLIAFVFACVLNFGAYWFLGAIAADAEGARLVGNPATAHLWIVSPLACNKEAEHARG